MTLVYPSPRTFKAHGGTSVPAWMVKTLAGALELEVNRAEGALTVAHHSGSALGERERDRCARPRAVPTSLLLACTLGVHVQRPRNQVEPNSRVRVSRSFSPHTSSSMATIIPSPSTSSVLGMPTISNAACSTSSSGPK